MFGFCFTSHRNRRYLLKLRSEQMTQSNGKCFFNVTHASSEGLTTPAHPSGWVHQGIIHRYRDIYIDICIDICIHTPIDIYRSLNLPLLKGLSGRS